MCTCTCTGNREWRHWKVFSNKRCVRKAQTKQSVRKTFVTICKIIKPLGFTWKYCLKLYAGILVNKFVINHRFSTLKWIPLSLLKSFVGSYSFDRGSDGRFSLVQGSAVFSIIVAFSFHFLISKISKNVFSVVITIVSTNLLQKKRIFNNYLHNEKLTDTRFHYVQRAKLSILFSTCSGGGRWAECGFWLFYELRKLLFYKALCALIFFDWMTMIFVCFVHQWANLSYGHVMETCSIHYPEKW